MGLQIKRADGEAPADWYVPEFRGNRTAPDDEQIAVEMLPMTAAQLQKKKERDFGGRDAGKHIIRASTAHRNEIIADRVKTVEGVANESGQRVTDGRMLVKEIMAANDPGLDALLDEIYGALTDRAKLDEGRRPS